jgi:hypothetical protein
MFFRDPKGKSSRNGISVPNKAKKCHHRKALLKSWSAIY